MWTVIGPILAQNYTVIAMDNRGCGDSSIPYSYDFAAPTVAEDIKGVLDFLHVNQTYILGFDKGAGIVAAFNAKYRSQVR